ncbi:hypothetical protein HGRIS_004147 [Hohenbuehelia grisea]|uniref:F-box domain-containing protein n=1 Tax=Hohenbuehelia grisea TaxID=104357 RepID=A0ABR3JIU7_9AGAR
MLELCDLPNELLIHICRLAAREIHLSLCRVSSRFKSICYPIVYGRIRVSTSSATVIKLFRTLLRSKTAASDVRNLYLNFVTPPDGAHLGAYSALILGGLNSLPSLAALEIEFDESKTELVTKCLQSCTFHQLQSFVIGYPASYLQPSGTLYEFLSRHPTLGQLTLRPPHAVPTLDPDMYQPLTLPQLTSFDGPKEWLVVAAPRSQLRYISVWWWDYTAGTPTLLQLPRDTVRASDTLMGLVGSARVLTSCSYGWDPRLGLVLGPLVYLSGICVKVFSTGDMKDKQPFMRILEDTVLPALSQLQVLTISEVSEPPNPVTATRLDELRIACKWQNICPTLRRVQLSGLPQLLVTMMLCLSQSLQRLDTGSTSKAGRQRYQSGTLPHRGATLIARSCGRC